MINGDVLLLESFVRETAFHEGILRIIAKRGVLMAENPEDPVSEVMKERLKGWLGEIGKPVSEAYEMSTLSDLIDETLRKLETPYCTNLDLYYDITSIRKAVHSGVRNQLIYRYPSNAAKKLLSWQNDWREVTVKIPTTETDIKLGVDLWALGHGTACIFHMMRVLEDGLIALAKELDVPIGADTWGKIINNIERAIAEEQTVKKYVGKKDKRKFFSEAAVHFGYFKDGWRNYVSHGKTFYSLDDAEKVMDHTRNFMILLASNLDLSNLDDKKSSSPADSKLTK